MDHRLFDWLFAKEPVHRYSDWRDVDAVDGQDGRLQCERNSHHCVLTSPAENELSVASSPPLCWTPSSL